MSAILVLFFLSFFQADPEPLPGVSSFLAEFRKTLHNDNVLLSQYTYSEKRTHIELDSRGRPGDTAVEVYEITGGSDPSTLYRRRISKNGVPVREEKPEKIRRAGPRDDNELIEDVFGVYDIQIAGREDIDGRSTIRLTFKPRADYKPKTRQGTVLKHTAGQAWVDESDYQLARVEAEVIDTVSLGFGLLAKLHKGARVYAERRKINDEVWLPAKTEVSVRGRIFLVKGINMREIVEYSDYMKFTVDTNLEYPKE